MGAGGINRKERSRSSGPESFAHSDIFHGQVSFNIKHDSRFDKEISLLA